MITTKIIRAYCNRIAHEFQPERIILFGSHAYGEPTPDSDVDLMVIMPFEGKAMEMSAEIRMRADALFPMDLMVRTPQQIESGLANEDWFITDIIEKGKMMYEAAHASVDRQS